MYSHSVTVTIATALSRCRFPVHLLICVMPLVHQFIRAFSYLHLWRHGIITVPTVDAANSALTRLAAHIRRPSLREAKLTRQATGKGQVASRRSGGVAASSFVVKSHPIVPFSFKAVSLSQKEKDFRQRSTYLVVCINDIMVVPLLPQRVGSSNDDVILIIEDHIRCIDKRAR